MGSDTIKFGHNSPEYTFKNNMNFSYEQRNIEVTNNGKTVSASDVIGGYNYGENPTVVTSEEARNLISKIAAASNDGKTEISSEDLKTFYANKDTLIKNGTILDITCTDNSLGKTYSVKYHAGSNKLLNIQENDYWMSFTLPKPKEKTTQVVQQPAQKEHVCPVSFWDDPLGWLEHRWLCH